MSAWRNPWFQQRARAEAKERGKKLSQQMAERARAADEARRLEREEVQSAEADLRASWGVEYATNRRFMGDKVRRMSPDMRLAYENELTAEGRRLGNDPATIRQIVNEQRAAPKWFAAEAAKYGSERKAFEALMRDKGSAYWRGPDKDRLQAHYRDVVRQEQLEEGASFSGSGDRNDGVLSG